MHGQVKGWLAGGIQVAWVYTLFMATLMGLLVGVTQKILGSPGDLPEVVHQIHTSGRIAISQAPSMFVCSAFSIAAGAFPHTTHSTLLPVLAGCTEHSYMHTLSLASLPSV